MLRLRSYRNTHSNPYTHGHPNAYEHTNANAYGSHGNANADSLLEHRPRAYGHSTHLETSRQD